jgi:hypothetical protein
MFLLPVAGNKNPMQLFPAFPRCSCNNTVSGITVEIKVAAFGRQPVTLITKSEYYDQKMVHLGMILLAVGFSLSAIKIVYSEPDRDDSRRLILKLPVKSGATFLFTKTSVTAGSLLDNDMKQIAKVEQICTDNDKMINADFFPMVIFAI